MNAMGIQLFLTGQLEKFMQQPDTRLTGLRRTRYTEVITPVADMQAEPFFNLPQMLVKLPTEICQPRIIRWLQNEFPDFRVGIQAAAAGTTIRPRSELGKASVIITSINCPNRLSGASKLTQRLFSVFPAN